MKNIKFRTWVLILLTLLIALSGFAAAKYVDTKTLGGTVSFTAKLADEFYLKESTADRQSNGTYSLNKNNPITGSKQSYVLIPGLDIPKDPYIVIKGKTTDIPTYLFLEVVDNVIVDNVIVDADKEKLLEYELESFWIPADTMKAPQQGGTVYVYGDPNTNKPIEIKEDHESINILKGETITVSQKLLSEGVAKTGSLTFYAYLEEAASHK